MKMKMKMKILIVYERKNRELESAVLLKLKFESLGHECVIAQFYESDKFNISKKSVFDVIFVPHLYCSKEVYRTLARFGNTKEIINLQYEQVLSKKWEDLGHHTPTDLAMNYKHICWGRATQTRLLNSGIKSDNCVLTGALHMDLLDSSIEASRQAKSNLSFKFNLSPDKKWKLFLSSFTYADISEASLKQNEKVANTDLSSFKDIHTQSRDELLLWFDAVLKKDRSSYLIYRPHPDEADLGKLKDLQTKYENFKVINYGGAKDWIQASELILSWYSTTVVESHFLKKPYVILRPIPLPDAFDSVLLKKGKFIRSLSAFESEVYFSDNYVDMALRDQDVESYYGGLQGNALSNISKLLESVANKGIPLMIKIPIADKIKTFLASRMYHLYQNSKNKHSSLLSIAYVSSWFKYFDVQIATEREVQEMINHVKSKCKTRGIHV